MSKASTALACIFMLCLQITGEASILPSKAGIQDQEAFEASEHLHPVNMEEFRAYPVVTPCNHAALLLAAEEHGTCPEEFRDLDFNGNGLVGFNEFMNFADRAVKPATTFRTMDQDNDGYLTINEFCPS